MFRIPEGTWTARPQLQWLVCAKDWPFQCPGNRCNTTFAAENKHVRNSEGKKEKKSCTLLIYNPSLCCWRLCLLTPRRLHRTTARWANSLQKAQKGRGNGSFFPIRKLKLTIFSSQKSNFAPWSPALQQRWWNSWNPWNECKPGPGRDVKPESHQAGEKTGVQFILWIYRSCEQEGTRETIHYAASAFLTSGSQISALPAGVRLGPWNLHPQRNPRHLNQSLMLPRLLSP